MRKDQRSNSTPSAIRAQAHEDLLPEVPRHKDQKNRHFDFRPSAIAGAAAMPEISEQDDVQPQSSRLNPLDHKPELRINVKPQSAPAIIKPTKLAPLDNAPSLGKPRS